MKAAKFILASACVFLVGCSSSGGASSSSSSSSSSSVVPSTTSTSTSTPAAASRLVSVVTNAASKYNGGLTAEKITTDAGLSLEAPATYGNMVLLLKSAFSSVMPDLAGQRVYGGIYTLPDSYFYTDAKVKKALEWMVSYGLWGNDNFVQNDTVSEDALNTIIKRFYTYFGTNEKDDFFATTNHDFLYEDSTDSEITPTTDYVKGKLLNTSETQKNIKAYSKTFADANTTDSPFYKQALGYYDGTLDYSFFADSEVTTELANIKAISDVASWSTYASKLLSDYGGCELLYYAGVSQLSTGLAPIFNVGVAPYFAVNGASNETYTNLISKIFTDSMNLTAEEASTYSKAFFSFQAKATTTYEGDDFKDEKGETSYIYDATNDKDLFANNDVSFDFKSIMTSGGFTSAEQAEIVTLDAGAFLTYGKTILSATVDELVATTLFEYAISNGSAIGYEKGTAGDTSKFMNLVGNNLAYDYMQTQDWTDSFNAFVDLFDGIKESFTSRVDSSSWLSDAGKTAVKEKLNAVSYLMVGKKSDNTLLDYASRKIASGLSIKDSFAKASRLKVKCIIDDVIAGGSGIEVYLLNAGPFYANAFYAPTLNSINITFASIFCIGTTLKGVSKEKLYGKIGYILGHEITHGFDSNGVLYDKTGKSVPAGIIPSDDMTKFTALTKKVISIYQKEEVLPGLVQDSNLTVTECAADIGGMVLMETLGSKVTGFDYKEFYKQYADGSGCKITRGAYCDDGYLVDVHPYGRVRVNCLLANSAKFQSTYELKEGDGMYRSSADQVVIW